MKTCFIALLLGAAAAPAFSQSVLVGWNFNNSVAGSGGNPGTFNSTGTVEVYNSSTKTLSPASHGVLAASATVNLANLAGTMGGSGGNDWGDFGGTTVNAVSGDASGGALAVIGSGQNGKHVDFSFSSLNFANLSVSYVTQRTGTGFTSQSWSYSIDGTNYTSLTTLSSLPSSFALESFSLSSALDNQSTAILRVTFDGASSTSGNNRIDNFTVTGTPIPEPSAAAAILGGLTALGVMLRRRRG